jgi:hypothetical protein
VINLHCPTLPDITVALAALAVGAEEISAVKASTVQQEASREAE